jgi:hypothetical protein
MSIHMQSIELNEGRTLRSLLWGAAAVNKQLNDKERVAAAFENPHLVELVEKCLVSTEE